MGLGASVGCLRRLRMTLSRVALQHQGPSGEGPSDRTINTLHLPYRHLCIVQLTGRFSWKDSVVQDDHVVHLMLCDDCIWDTGQPLYDPDAEHCAGILPWTLGRIATVCDQLSSGTAPLELFGKDVIPLSDSINNQELLSHIVPFFLDNRF
jgi:hypothetical protein